MSRSASRQRKKIVFLLKVTGFYQVFISFILKNILEEEGKILICWDTFQISSNKAFLLQCCDQTDQTARIQWRNEPRQAVSSPWCDQILSMLFYCYIQRWQHWYLFDVILPTSHLHNYTLFYSNLLWFHVAKLSPTTRSSSVLRNVISSQVNTIHSSVSLLICTLSLFLFFCKIFPILLIWWRPGR